MHVVQSVLSASLRWFAVRGSAVLIPAPSTIFLAVDRNATPWYFDSSLVRDVRSYSRISMAFSFASKAWHTRESRSSLLIFLMNAALTSKQSLESNSARQPD